jgi:hypothetical protein
MLYLKSTFCIYKTAKIDSLHKYKMYKNIVLLFMETKKTWQTLEMSS